MSANYSCTPSQRCTELINRKAKAVRDACRSVVPLTYTSTNTRPDSLLARSAKLPTGLYILLALISYFIFNDFLETNYVTICWTDFHNLFTE